jgi:hypothetical protein
MIYISYNEGHTLKGVIEMKKMVREFYIIVGLTIWITIYVLIKA